MAIYEGITIGVGIIMFSMFYLWSKLREDHKELAILFFGMGIVALNMMTFMMLEFLRYDSATKHLNGFSTTIFTVFMWFSIIVLVYVVFQTFFGFLKTFINWIAFKLGLRPPFEE
jgi:hypothetical protein